MAPARIILGVHHFQQWPNTMMTHLIISVISDDKPGVVEAVAEKISGAQGNWLESQLSQLAGKFAGIIRVAVPSEHKDQLLTALATLEKNGIWITADDAPQGQTSEDICLASFHALGPDRAGIVRELSKAFADNRINVAKLDTSLSSMPYSGEPLFEASGKLEIPSNYDISELYAILDKIADGLALDISLSEQSEVETN